VLKARCLACGVACSLLAVLAGALMSRVLGVVVLLLLVVLLLAAWARPPCWHARTAAMARGAPLAAVSRVHVVPGAVGPAAAALVLVLALARMLLLRGLDSSGILKGLLLGVAHGAGRGTTWPLASGGCAVGCTGLCAACTGTGTKDGSGRAAKLHALGSSCLRASISHLGRRLRRGQAKRAPRDGSHGCEPGACGGID
jgi:hypothetical protein